jgi:histidinol-phosphate aminotransferase
MSGYERPTGPAGGLRLHLNENTAGCSPRVLDAVRSLTNEDLAFYPEYHEVVAETARYLGVPRDSLVLTNGLDEGIMAAATAVARSSVQVGGPRPEVIVPLPAFEMYAVCARAVGARVIDVPPTREDFCFQLDAVLSAISPATRLVYITSPNNPTGVRIAADDIARVADAVPPQALVFVDEAYYDFCGDTVLPLLDRHPNLIAGRTFAKAHGLAALRVGCLIAQVQTMNMLRDVVLPYNLNVCAAAGLTAALADDDRLKWYVAQAAESRALVYAACARLGLRYWESGGNFVLVRVGPRAAAVVAELGRRGIIVRERARDPGCEGCIRITAGVVDHTARCLAALEEVLCGVV